MSVPDRIRCRQRVLGSRTVRRAPWCRARRASTRPGARKEPSARLPNAHPDPVHAHSVHPDAHHSQRRVRRRHRDTAAEMVLRGNDDCLRSRARSGRGRGRSGRRRGQARVVVENTVPVVACVLHREAVATFARRLGRASRTRAGAASWSSGADRRATCTRARPRARAALACTWPSIQGRRRRAGCAWR